MLTPTKKSGSSTLKKFYIIKSIGNFFLAISKIFKLKLFDIPLVENLRNEVKYLLQILCKSHCICYWY